MSAQKERMLRGGLYLPDDPELAADRQRCQLLVERFNATSVTETAARQEILGELFGHLGTGVEINPLLQCDYGYQVSIGDRSFINYGAVILDCAKVTIGDDVQFGPNVQLLTATHPLDPEARRTRCESGEPIVIDDNMWFGGGVIVCPGVTVGRDTVVGAGSVVTRDLPPRVVAAGNPCRVIREL